MQHNIYEFLQSFTNGKKGYFCLIDPDKTEPAQAANRALQCQQNGADAILVGGSLMLKNNFELALQHIKNKCDIPVIIFPGLFDFVSPLADALLLLSMLSSRNPQMLIGEQVRAAPLIKLHNIEAIGTAYLLVGGGAVSSVQYMSSSLPIPGNKADIAVAHALAGQYLGMKLVYMDAGSGAAEHIPLNTIKAVKQAIDLPVIVGGGIKTPNQAAMVAAAGADIVVTGTALEKKTDCGLINEFANAVHRCAHD